MWQYELVQSAGSAESPHSWNSQTCDLIATFTFAEGVSTSLSLPWSLYEHMVGNWLISVTNPIEPANLPDLVARFKADLPTQTRAWLKATILPGTTAGLLESVLAAGRSFIKAAAEAPSDSGVGTEDEGLRVQLVPLR